MVVFAMFAFTPASEQPSKVQAVASNAAEAVAMEERGIGCKVYNDDGVLIRKCFICNCSKL